MRQHIPLICAQMPQVIRHCFLDLRRAFRGLLGRPQFTLAVVALLAIGIGVNAGLVSILHRLLLRTPAEVQEPDRVVRLYAQVSDNGTLRTVTTFDQRAVVLLESTLASIGRVAVYNVAPGVRIGRGDAAPPITVSFARAEYFDLLRVRPYLGRFFSKEEAYATGESRPAVISYSLWQRLGADSGVLETELEMNRERLRIIGVAPRRFSGVDLDGVDVWLTLRPNVGRAQVLVRLTEGTDPGRVAILATAAVREVALSTATRDTSVVVRTSPLRLGKLPGLRGSETSLPLGMAAVALVLLVIVCANIGNLLLARSFERDQEMSIRAALGATRGQLISLVLSETCLLALMGGIAGVAIGAWTQQLIQRLLFVELHWDHNVLDVGLVCAIAVLGCVASLLAGAIPAWHASRVRTMAIAIRSSRSSGYRRSPARVALVVSQVALTTIAVVGAGLFLKSLHNIRAVDIGYDSSKLTYGTLYLPDSVPRTARLEELAQRIVSHPSVAGVALATRAPLRGVTYSDTFFVSGLALPESFWDREPAWIGVTASFFEVVGMDVIRGRPFQAEDRHTGARVTVINAAMASAVWGTKDPLGSCIRFLRTAAPCYTVVGVVSNGNQLDIIEEPSFTYYLPLWRLPFSDSLPNDIIVRADERSAPTIQALLRAEMAEVFPRADVLVRPLDALLAPQLQSWRSGALMFSLFGVLTLFVATLGVYATVAQSLAQGKHEVGVKLALGATPSSLLRSVVASELRAVVIGAAAGAVVAVFAGRLATSLLFGVPPHDPMTLVVALLVVCVAAILACLSTARAISTLAPAAILRAE